MSSSRKRSRHDEEPSSSSRELREIRDKYEDLKDEVKRKKRDIEDLEDELEKQVRETKKARKDTQDLWKIYYTLQSEVQEAYKNNAKLGAEKETAAQENAELQKKIDRLNAGGSGDAEKMREALIAMQKDKTELQKKFNDIVIDNKRLKEAVITYEPRLRELDDVKKELADVNMASRNANGEFQKFQDTLRSVGGRLSGLAELQRWVQLLSKEAGEKAAALQAVQPRLRLAEEARTAKAEADARNVLLQARRTDG